MLSLDGFLGTNIAIFGTVPISPPDGRTSVITYALDDSTPVNISGPVTNTILYEHPFYSSPPLDYGQHTLTVTGAAVDSNTTFWFDYLEYTPLSTTANTAVASPNSSSAVNQPGTVTGDGSSPSSRAASQRSLSAGETSSSFGRPLMLTKTLTSASSTSSGASYTSLVPSIASSASSSTTSTSAGAGTARTTDRHLVAALITTGVAIAALVLFLIALLLWWRKRRARQRYEEQMFEKENILDDVGWSGAYATSRYLTSTLTNRASVPSEARMISQFGVEPRRLRCSLGASSVSNCPTSTFEENPATTTIYELAQPVTMARRLAEKVNPAEERPPSYRQ